MAKIGLMVGGLIGIILPSLELLRPKYRKTVPLAIELGISRVIPISNSPSRFIGALTALILERSRSKMADEYVIPVTSRAIAGE
jgi:hypothetical protein